MPATQEATMPATPRRSPDPGPPARSPSLLGSYPVPELRLVGAPVQDDPRSPTQWQPTEPPPQYGVDYTFLRRAGREPIRWPYASVITVRTTRPANPGRHATLAAVVAELRALTKLDLVIGEPVPASLAPTQIPEGEIHVRYLPGSKLSGPAGQCGGTGVADASRCAAGCCYITGFAVVNADLAGPDATAGHGLALLRHQLAHALGLGHAARPSSLMYGRPAADVTRYGRGDRYGLALLGPSHIPRE